MAEQVNCEGQQLLLDQALQRPSKSSSAANVVLVGLAVGYIPTGHGSIVPGRPQDLEGGFRPLQACKSLHSLLQEGKGLVAEERRKRCIRQVQTLQLHTVTILPDCFCIYY